VWSDVRTGEDKREENNCLISGEEESEEQYLVVGGLPGNLL
jgi:hypothetical protein